MADGVVTTVFLLIGAVFVALVLRWFWVGERYRLPSQDLGPAERAWVAQEAADQLAELAPDVMLLVEKERAVETVLRDETAGALGAFARWRAGEAELRGFWEGFARVSVLVEEDPARTVRESPALRGLLEKALEACDGVLGMLEGAEEMVEPAERGEARGGE